MGKILELIPQLMQEIGVVGKSGYNTQNKHKFRSIDDVMNAVHPALVKLKITPTFNCPSESIFRETLREQKSGGGERLIFRTSCQTVVTLKADDGSAETYSAVGEGLDYGGDKSANKAMSAGYKYALGHGLCIPFEDVEDSDRDTKHPTKELQSTGVDILAAANATATVAHPVAATAPFDPLPLVHGDQNAACAVEQRNRIIELAQKLAWPPEALSAICQKRGKSKLAELTVGEAFEVVGNLEKLCTDSNIPL